MFILSMFSEIRYCSERNGKKRVGEVKKNNREREGNMGEYGVKEWVERQLVLFEPLDLRGFSSAFVEWY